MSAPNPRPLIALRWQVVLLVSLATALSYLDRQTLPIAIKAIEHDIPIDARQFANLNTAFLLTYAIMYAVGGRIIDVLGTRARVLDRHVVLVAGLCGPRVGHEFRHAGGVSLSEMARSLVTKESLDYDPIYAGDSEWRLLPSIDHPTDPAHCMVSGTGLTHLGSASDRSAMHAVAAEQLTDSMKMFRWGVEGGKPEEGRIGVAPEWFFKGNGLVLRANGEPLVMPSYAEDGGEEAEVAVAYLIGPDGTPFRLGLTIGNEFSDHVFEKKNYLNLASSKIRTCSVGPELVVDPSFSSVPGEVTLERGGKVFWSKAIATGEAEMVHSLRNIEHHHFKFESHRQPGDVHVHFLGAYSLSFGAGVRLADGDLMTVAFDDFGRALRNPLRLEQRSETPVSVTVLR